jgi:hypothetical protein
MENQTIKSPFTTTNTASPRDKEFEVKEQTQNHMKSSQTALEADNKAPSKDLNSVDMDISYKNESSAISPLAIDEISSTENHKNTAKEVFENKKSNSEPSHNIVSSDIIIEKETDKSDSKTQEDPTPGSNSINKVSNYISDSIDIPAIGEITDDVGNTQGTITPGAASNDTTPTLSGTAEFGQTVNIYDNGDLIGSASVRRNGTWSFTPTTPLLDGLHSFTITNSSDGNTSVHSAPYPILVDTRAPDRPNIKSIYDDHGSQVGYYPNDASISDAQPTIYGRSESNSSVILYDNGKEIARVEVGSSGNWSFTPTQPLSDGLHQITLKAIDAAENESPLSDAFNFTVDTQPPSQPTIDALVDNQGQHTGEIAPGGLTDDNTPLIKGSAEPGSKITIMLDGIPWDIVVTNENGQWTYIPDIPFSEGQHSLSATATDKVGNTSEASAPFTFTINSTEMTISITGAIDNEGSNTGSLVAGSTTDDATPTLRGTANANAIVKVYDGEILLGQTKANGVGIWAFTPTDELSEGPHLLTATVTVDGYESPHSGSFGLVIDRTAPDNQGVGEVTDSSGQPILDGETTQDKQPTFSGHGEPGATVTITDNGKIIGKSIVNDDGQWSFTPEQELKDGSHSIEVVITDEAGNSSEPSDIHTIIVGQAEPSAPIILAILDDVGAVTGAVAKDGITDDNRPTLVGKATPGESVVVYRLDGQKKIYVGEADVDATGTWKLTPDHNLPDGLTIFNTFSDSFPEDASNSWSVTIDTSGKTPPAITSIYDDSGSLTGDITNGGTTDDTRPTLSGTALANATVMVYVGDKLLGETKANASGIWNFTPSSDLADGYRTFSVESVDAAGQKHGTSDNWLINIDTVAPNAPVITGITDDVGAVTGAIDKHGTTDDPRPTLQGQAEAFSIITVYNGTQVLGNTYADQNGNWTFTPVNDLISGQYSFAVSATDSAGNSGPISAAWLITVSPEVIEPYETTITSIYDDIGNTTGVVGQHGVTDDLLPTFSGTTKPGSTVLILRGPVSPPVLVGTAVANADGNWSYTPDHNLPEGQHDFYAKGLDGGTISETWSLTIDSSAPDKPTISAVYETLDTSTSEITNGGATGDQTPLITGKAQANSTVIIKNGEQIIGSATADAAGDWSFTPTLEYGVYNLSALSVDQADNQSEPSEPFSLSILTSAMYDFESFDIGNYGALEHKGIVFSDFYWWWYQNQIVEVDGSKVGLVEGSAVIAVTWPEGASSTTLNIWSKDPDTSGEVRVIFSRNGVSVGEQILESMPIDPEHSLVTLGIPSGTFDQVQIIHNTGSFYVDNINAVRGENHTPAVESSDLAEPLMDAAIVATTQTESEQPATSKPVLLQLSTAGLLEDGQDRLYSDASKLPNDVDKRLALNDLVNEAGELSTPVTSDTHATSYSEHHLTGIPNEMLAQAGLEIDTTNHV